METAFTRRFGVAHPIVLAPMDKLADAALVTAVGRGGGLGLLGGGYGDAEWLAAEVAKLPAGLPFGIGFITWSMARKPGLLQQALAAKPAAICLSFDDPRPFAAAIKAAGVALICQVQDIASARLALEAGADVIVAQGTEGGGHGGSRGTITLVPAVRDLAPPGVIVLAAGGIADGRGLAAALMLGADGVMVGSRFYATDEAAAHAKAKQRIAEAQGDATLRSIIFDISRQNVWPVPMTGRCLANAHAERWRGREVELAMRMGVEGPRYAAAAAAGDFDTAAVIAGEAVDMIASIEPAGDIVRSMSGEAERLLGRMSNRA